MYQTIRYEKKDGIGIATINRPEALNALNSTVISELEQLIGEVEKDEGEIRLLLRLDLDRRPMQVVDYAHGKEAVTRYRVLARSSGATRVEFVPLTGRTHQLRVHAAHQSGLNAPIKGDMLYGNFSDRLYLHASFLKFNHPVDNKEIILESIPNF